MASVRLRGVDGFCTRVWRGQRLDGLSAAERIGGDVADGNGAEFMGPCAVVCWRFLDDGRHQLHHHNRSNACSGNAHVPFADDGMEPVDHRHHAGVCFARADSCSIDAVVRSDVPDGILSARGNHGQQRAGF